MSTDLLEFYRDLHAHPELGFREVRTTARVAGALRAAGYTVTTSEQVTGLVASLVNGPGPVVALRADIDALPIAEQTGLPYASTATGPQPAMHACGHDIHTTALVGAAQRLADERHGWSGTVVLIAQPAEELGNGARELARSGLLERHPRPQVLLGQHVGSHPAGIIRSRPGVYEAGQRNWRITLRGPGGHAASPHRSASLLAVAAQIILRLEAIVGQQTEPGQTAVLAPTTIHAGQATNVIPAELTLTACARAFSAEVLDRIDAAVRRIVLAAAAGEDLRDEPVIETFNDFSLNVNDPDSWARAREALAAEFGAGSIEQAEPLLGSEDFGDLGAHLAVPSAYWHFGVAAASGAAHPDKALAGHSPYFAPDPAQALDVGVRALTAAARGFLLPADQTRASAA